MVAARADAAAAEVARIAAAEAARNAERALESRCSVFFSRDTQRLYVRQAFQPILDIRSRSGIPNSRLAHMSSPLWSEPTREGCNGVLSHWSAEVRMSAQPRRTARRIKGLTSTPKKCLYPTPKRLSTGSSYLMTQSIESEKWFRRNPRSSFRMKDQAQKQAEERNL